MNVVTVGTPALWGGFVLFVLAMLALDLGVFHRKAHVIHYKEALLWSGIWVAMSLLFNVLVYHWFGTRVAVEFLTGYLIEKSLAVDNIFVFVVIFTALGIPSIHQHRVLFWGIISALLMRAAMIFAGAALLAKFHWFMYVFGAFLIFTGAKLFLQRGEEHHPEESKLLRLARRFIPTTARIEGPHFIVRQGAGWMATPLLMALILVEITDVIFAVDSIPAIFAVTQDPFIVFTSNIFAILGLRSMFFLMAGLVDKFVYLKVGLAAVLVFVGVKMTIVDLYKIPHLISLAVIAVLLGSSVLASWLRSRRTGPASV